MKKTTGFFAISSLRMTSQTITSTNDDCDFRNNKRLSSLVFRLKSKHVLRNN